MKPDLPFADLKPAEKRYWVEVTLPKVLAHLPGPAPTVVVSGMVARELGCKADEVGGTILALAHDHPAARQDGPKFKRYGRTMTGWRWYPQDPPPKIILEDKLPATRDLIPEPEAAKALPKDCYLVDGVVRSIHDLNEEWE